MIRPVKIAIFSNPDKKKLKEEVDKFYLTNPNIISTHFAVSGGQKDFSAIYAYLIEYREEGIRKGVYHNAVA